MKNKNWKKRHETLIAKAKELLDFAGSGKVTIKQGVDGVAITVEAKS
tara:strand:- start:597 stop:737 length:141 start_codon:yes stop_codon:yes gene_type:complete